MATSELLERTALTDDERALLVRFVERLERRLGPELHGVWLFGSKARGEVSHEDSDVDLLVLVDDSSWDGRKRVWAELWAAGEELDLSRLAFAYFSPHIKTLDWLAGRREIRSFFIQEVDRDKIVLSGSA